MADPLDSVLVATDFSPPSELALSWGAQIARSHGARLVLVHVLAPPMPVADFAAPPLTIARELREAARERLDEILAGPTLEGIEAEGRLVDGIPAQAVLAAAGEAHAHLLVVGTRGLTGFRHMLLGSTAERIVQGATVPVLSVHPEDRRAEAAPRTVLVPTDFSSDAQAALAAADHCVSLSDQATHVILLHVFHVPAEYHSYGPAGSFFKFTDKLRESLRERLEALAAPVRRQGLTTELLTTEGIPEEVIVRVATERKVDLVAMGTHGRSGLAHLLIGSTAERVVQHAPCPVLTVRRSAEE